MFRNFTWAATIAVAFIAGFMPVTVDLVSASAAPTAVKPADKLSRVMGFIGTVDTKDKTITLGGVGTGDHILAYNDGTKFWRDIPAGVSDIKIGDTLRAIALSGGNEPSATSITPNFVNIVPPVDIVGPPFPGPFTKLQGVVVTLNPLTIATTDKKTIAINITTGTLLSKSVDATVADAKTGMFGSSIVKGGDILTELHIVIPPQNK